MSGGTGPVEPGPPDTSASEPTAPVAPTTAHRVAGSPPASSPRTPPTDPVPHSPLVGFMSEPASSRIPVRRSTVLMVVAFAGFATLMGFYPPQSSPAPASGTAGYFVPVSTTTTTTPATTTTAPPATTTPTTTRTPSSTTTTGREATTTTTTRSGPTTTTTADRSGTTTTSGSGAAGTSTTVGATGAQAGGSSTTTAPGG